MIFSKEEKKTLLELISNEQIHMLMKNCDKYESEKYKKLEELKIKINELYDYEDDGKQDQVVI